MPGMRDAALACSASGVHDNAIRPPGWPHIMSGDNTRQTKPDKCIGHLSKNGKDHSFIQVMPLRWDLLHRDVRFFAFIGGGLSEKVFAVYLREFAVRLLLLWREIFAGG